VHSGPDLSQDRPWFFRADVPAIGGSEFSLEGRMSIRSHTATATWSVAIAILATGSITSVLAESDEASELRIYNWENFIDPDIIDGFETEFGIDITVETFSD
jgi:hypothetical protein